MFLKLLRRTNTRMLLGVLFLPILVATTASSTLPAGENKFGGLFGDSMNIDGGNFEYNKDHNAVIIRDYAVLTLGAVKIQARNMIYFTSSQDIYAEGDVLFDDPGNNSAFTCDQLLFNTTDWHGQATNVRIKAGIPGTENVRQEAFLRRPHTDTESHDTENSGVNALNSIIASANDMRSLNRNHQEGIGVNITTSRFAKPHWKITSKAVNFRRREKMESWGNTVWIGKVPVFWFPYIIKDLKYDWPWVRISAGHTNEWGTYGLTKFGLDFDTDNKRTFRIDEIFLDVDYRQDRGLGLGAEMRYEMGRNESYGFLDYYWTRESISDENDMERAMEDNDYPGENYKSNTAWKPSLYNDKDRWALDWWHWQQLTSRWELLMEAHAYGDRDFRREYFEKRYKGDKVPETSAMLRYVQDAWELELVASKRTNDWQNQAEYMPEARLSVHDYRLGNLPLYLQSYSSAGWVNYKFDEDAVKLGIEDEDEHGSYFRAHNDTRIYSPIHLGRLAVLKPYIGGRATYYGKTRDEDDPMDSDGAEFNSAMLYGAELSSSIYGVFGTNGRFRHLIQPVISYQANEQPTHENSRLYRIDSTEDYRESHIIRYALNQKIKRNHGEFLDFNMYVDQYPISSEQDDLNHGRAFSDIHFDTNIRLSGDLLLFGNADIDSKDGNINRLNGGFDWRLSRSRIYMAHQWRRGDFYQQPTSDASSETTLALRSYLWDPNSSHYSTEIAMTYQWENNNSVDDGMQDLRVSLIRDLDTFDLYFTVFHDWHDDDYGFMVNLVPKAFGGIDRDPSVMPAPQMELEGRYDQPKEESNNTTKPFSAEDRAFTLY